MYYFDAGGRVRLTAIAEKTGEFASNSGDTNAIDILRDSINIPQGWQDCLVFFFSHPGKLPGEGGKEDKGQGATWSLADRDSQGR